jgi:hypothetical protein
MRGKVLVLGAGYAGLNTYYELRRRGYQVLLFDQDDQFKFYSALFKLVEGKRMDWKSRISGVRKARVEDVDESSITVKTEDGYIQGDYMVIALGCDKSDQVRVILDEKGGCIGTESEFDEYITLQVSLLSKGKFKYHGSPLSWLGRRVSQAVEELATSGGLRTCETPNLILPKCKPPAPYHTFLKPGNTLKLSEGVFAAGDVVGEGPKLGELSMRMGIHVANSIAKGESEFKPLFIYILYSPKGRGIRVKSDVPWGGRREEVSPQSWVYPYMKEFLYRYYLMRRGRMGLLKYL